MKCFNQALCATALAIALVGSPVEARSGEAIEAVELQWLDSSASVRIPGLETGSLCCRMAFVGDVNGDGFDDLALSAGETHDGVGDVGTVYVLFGGVDWPHTLDLKTLDGDNGFAVWGDEDLRYVGSLNGAGDLNGDGFDDLIFGAGGSVEKAYVVFGASEFAADVLLTEIDGTNGFEILKSSGGDFAAGVVGGFDLNRDGMSDVAVSDRESGEYGELYVIFGRKTFPALLSSSDLNGSDGFVIEGAASNRIGDRLTGLADFNGDGWNDLAMADWLAGPNATVLFGQEAFPSRVSLQGFGPEEGATISSSGVLFNNIADAGDVNGDGIGDVLLGTNGWNQSAGAAYVVYGSLALPSDISLPELQASEGFVFVGEQTGGYLGDSGVGIGDYNADGFDDVLIGAYFMNIGPDRTDAGAAFVLFGGQSIPFLRKPSDIDGVNGFQLLGAVKGDAMLAQVRSGDLNGDGKPDLAVASVLADLAGTNSGLAYVIYDPVRPTITLDQTGSCPGEVTRSVSYIAPHQSAGLYQSTILGETIVENGPCAGAVLGLANAQLRRIDFADEVGSFTETAELPVGLCSLYVQYLDSFTCEASEVSQVPN